MSGPAHFAVLQRELASPSRDALKRAFASFSNLTDADAIRLANSARGILMRQMRRDNAQALQRSLEAAGIGAVVVAESDLPRLPEGKTLRRLEILPQSFVVHDLLDRKHEIAWDKLTLVAAAEVQHFEMGKVTKDASSMGFKFLTTARNKKTTEVIHKVESDKVFLLEIILADGHTRYQIDAAGFPFKYVLDRPDLTIPQKFVWLVREICERATRATLNEGARCFVQGHELAPYLSRQAFADEIVWLLWHASSL